MPRKRLPPEERKNMFAVRIKQKYIDQMKKIKGYNKIVEELIRNYLKDKE